MKSLAGRHLRHRLAPPLAVWLVFQFPAAAADIVVGGDCSLREAVDNANPHPFPSPDCTLGDPGADTIILNDDVVFSTPHTFWTQTAALFVASEIVLEGNGHTISRVPSMEDPPDFGIFLVSNTGDLTLRNTTVSSGRRDRGGGLLELADDTVVSAEVHEECEIRVGPDFLVLGPGGDLTLTAGTQVSLGDGFGVETGAALVIGIDGDLQVLSVLEAAANAGWLPPESGR